MTDRMTEYNSIIMAKDRLTGEDTSFIYGLGLNHVDNAGELSFYRVDDRDSVTGLFDVHGNVTAVIGYDEYGMLREPYAAKVAEIHTHAAYDPGYANDVFSSTDLNKWINYVVTPLGTVRKYDPKNPSSESDYAIEIFNDVPFDPNHPDR